MFEQICMYVFAMCTYVHIQYVYKKTSKLFIHDSMNKNTLIITRSFSTTIKAHFLEMDTELINNELN